MANFFLLFLLFLEIFYRKKEVTITERENLFTNNFSRRSLFHQRYICICYNLLIFELIFFCSPFAKKEKLYFFSTKVNLKFYLKTNKYFPTTLFSDKQINQKEV